MFGKKLLYSGKKVVIWKMGCICVKVVVFGKVVVLGQKWLYFSNVVVFWQDGCILAKWFIRERWLYSSKMVVFG